MNSANSGNLINHWGINWAQFKDPVCYLFLTGTVLASLIHKRWQFRTRIHSNKMRTALTLPYGGGISLTETPLDRDPPDRDPLDRDPPPRQRPTWQRSPRQRPPGHRSSQTDTTRDPLDSDPPDRDLPGQSPPRTESQIAVKTLPSRNFVYGQ